MTVLDEQARCGGQIYRNISENAGKNQKLLEILGADSYSGISFDEQWEIEPGIWTFEFWSGDTKLGEEQFEVITPPIS